MTVRCLPRACLVLSLLAVAWLAQTESRPAHAADKTGLTHERLKQLVKEALDKGWIDFTPPSNQFAGDLLNVSDVSFEQGWDETSYSRDSYIAVFFQQVEIELRRRYLFKLNSSRQVIEPYFQRMEKIVGKELGAMRDKTLDDDAFNAKMDEFVQQMQSEFEAGLSAVARSVGKRAFQFTGEGAFNGHDVKLVAAQGAMIELVPQTTALVQQGAGKKEDELPWISYQANETAELSGTYYCRISLNGKQQTLTKKVGKTTTTLEFPKP